MHGFILLTLLISAFMPAQAVTGMDPNAAHHKASLDREHPTCGPGTADIEVVSKSTPSDAPGTGTVAWRARRNVAPVVRGAVSGKVLKPGEPVRVKGRPVLRMAPLPEQDPSDDHLVSMVSKRCLGLAEAGIREGPGGLKPPTAQRGPLLYRGSPGVTAA
jgi:hypothetical protein